MRHSEHTFTLHSSYEPNSSCVSFCWQWDRMLYGPLPMRKNAVWKYVQKNVELLSCRESRLSGRIRCPATFRLFLFLLYLLSEYLWNIHFDAYLHISCLPFTWIQFINPIVKSFEFTHTDSVNKLIKLQTLYYITQQNANIARSHAQTLFNISRCFWAWVICASHLFYAIRWCVDNWTDRTEQWAHIY